MKRILVIALAAITLGIYVQAQKPTIISRSDWKANKPVGEGKKHKIESFTSIKVEGVIGGEREQNRPNKRDVGTIREWEQTPRQAQDYEEAEYDQAARRIYISQRSHQTLQVAQSPVSIASFQIAPP